MYPEYNNLSLKKLKNTCKAMQLFKLCLHICGTRNMKRLYFLYTKNLKSAVKTLIVFGLHVHSYGINTMD
jgi:hypothetical protein